MKTTTLAQPNTITKEQARQYEELGYFVAPNVLSKSEVSEMLVECESILAGEYGELYQGAVEQARGSTVERVAERRITAVVESSLVCRQLLLKKDLVLRVQDIRGPDNVLFRDLLMLKPALVGSKMPWHQDSNYWPIE